MMSPRPGRKAFARAARMTRATMMDASMGEPRFVGCSPPSLSIEPPRASILCELGHTAASVRWRPAGMVPRVQEKLPIAVLVSGTGTNLQALLDTVHGHEARDRGGGVERRGCARAGARRRARRADGGVSPHGVRGPRGARRAMADWLQERGRAPGRARRATWSCSARRFLGRFHGRGDQRAPLAVAGLPGAEAIEQALAYGVKVFGVTVHFVDAGVDSGPVILQRAVELPHARDPEEVLRGAAPARAHAACPRRCACSRAGR